MLLRAAAVTLVELDEIERAEARYHRVLNVYRKAKPPTRRRALLGLAECAIFAGKPEPALEHLRGADAIPVGKRDVRGDAVRVGHLSRAIEDYIRRKEFDAARELLDAWEWEYPLDRLVGYSTVLRARLHLMREEYRKAVRLLTSLVTVNPKSNYAGEALLVAGDAWAKLGDKEKSRNTYKRVLRDYPESPFVKAAKERLGVK